MNYDIFNGDADGIIALLQLRLADPIGAELVTGVKRDIKLVEKVEVQAGDELTVLDISMEKNMVGLEQALAQGAHVFTPIIIKRVRFLNTGIWTRTSTLMPTCVPL